MTRSMFGLSGVALAAAGAAMTAMVAAPVQAQSLTPGVCDVSDVTLDGSNAFKCDDGVNSGPGGNATVSSIENAFGGTWSKLGQEDAGTSGTGGITVETGQSGNWSFDFTGDSDSRDGSAFKRFAVVLKASTDASAYLFKDANGFADFLSGTWDTRSLSTPSGQQPTLSNFSVYASEQVPEPLTILGTAAAAGIGYGLKRKRDALLAQEEA